jgi:hypothetical protein
MENMSAQDTVPESHIEENTSHWSCQSERKETYAIAIHDIRKK